MGLTEDQCINQFGSSLAAKAYTLDGIYNPSNPAKPLGSRPHGCSTYAAGIYAWCQEGTENCGWVDAQNWRVVCQYTDQESICNKQKNGVARFCPCKHTINITASAEAGMPVQLSVPNAHMAFVNLNAFACNSLGCSTASISDATGVPSAPSSLEVRVAGGDQLSLNIGPPEDDGGANVTRYNVAVYNLHRTC